MSEARGRAMPGSSPEKPSAAPAFGPSGDLAIYLKVYRKPQCNLMVGRPLREEANHRGATPRALLTFAISRPPGFRSASLRFSESLPCLLRNPAPKMSP